MNFMFIQLNNSFRVLFHFRYFTPFDLNPVTDSFRICYHATGVLLGLIYYLQFISDSTISISIYYFSKVVKA